MNKQVLKQIRDVPVGALLRVEWFDASTGKAAMGGPIDIPVKSWGIFLGVFGERNKHVVLAQNMFRMNDQGLYDLDFTAIPLSWTVSVSVIAPNGLDSDEAHRLMQSFIAGATKKRTTKRAQRRIKNHAI